MVTNVLEFIEFAALHYPEHTMVENESATFKYRDFLDVILRIGSHLIERFSEVRKPIVVFMDKCPECLAAFFGIIASGNFYVCIDSKMAPERISNIFSTLNPLAIITKSDTIPVSVTCPQLNYEDLVVSSIHKELLQKVRDKMIDTDPVYVLYTSGSTGMPKGSVITHQSVIAYTEWLVETFHFDNNTIFGNQTPFYFSMSVLDIYSCIRCAGTLQIIPKKLFSFPLKLLEYLNERKINTIYWVPSALSIVANWEALDYVSVPTLKTILFAGEVMPTKQLNVWRSHIPNALYANLFGPTEITDIALYYILDRDFADEESIPIGRSCKNMDAFAVTENGTEIKDDEIGELYFRGSFVGKGYYNLPDKTQEVFVQNPLNQAYPEIVYKTGDLVRKNAYGEFMYAGRKDYQIKHMGYRIELGEIEAAANANRGVNSCACLYHTEKDQIILLFQGDVSIADLRTHLLNYLPAYMCPAEIIQLTVMPQNANGKIDRQLLNETYINS